jgi:hypothetical protein
MLNTFEKLHQNHFQTRKETSGIIETLLQSRSLPMRFFVSSSMQVLQLQSMYALISNWTTRVNTELIQKNGNPSRETKAAQLVKKFLHPLLNLKVHCRVDMGSSFLGPILSDRNPVHTVAIWSTLLLYYHSPTGTIWN